MRFLAWIILLPLSSWAQPGLLQGNLVDDQAKPLLFATVALLNPADSTLTYFAITNGEGALSLKM